MIHQEVLQSIPSECYAAHSTKTWEEFRGF